MGGVLNAYALRRNEPPHLSFFRSVLPPAVVQGLRGEDHQETRMNSTAGKCLTCYDSGELVTELGPVACPDCAGEPGAVSAWGQMERRLRDIEQRYADKHDVGPEVHWLV